MSEGTDLIEFERFRQTHGEGYSKSHDSEHDDESLVRAAACYLLSNYPTFVQDMWPWEKRYWKPVPADRIRELVKAGALVAAEIDRLLAISEAEGEK